jgi:phosphoserine phosphatase RsbU/P
MSTPRTAPTERRREDSLLQAVFEHAARISRERRIDEVVRLNAEFARELAGADRCTLWLVDEAAEELWTRLPHGVGTLRVLMGEGLVGACIREDRVLVVNEAANEPLLLRSVDGSTGYQTEQALCVPLRTDGKVIGALQLLNKRAGFTQSDARLIELLGRFAASAIESERLRQVAESARLVRHELALARDVQMRLLPVCPTGVEGLECIGFCRPARSIGGDYYDLLPLVDGRFALTLGDVSGKGIPAAMMMASIQTLLRSLLLHDPKTLAAVMAELNHTLVLNSTPERYSTLFCGVVSAERDLLTYVNAGNVSPLLLREGRLQRLPGEGFPVGMLTGITWDVYRIALKPGDTLVVLSDGIVEARDAAGEFWDEAEVERVLLKHRDAPLAEIPVELCRAADGFAAGAEQNDDMTVVAIRVPAPLLPRVGL